MLLEIGEVFNDNGVDLIIIKNEKVTCTGCYYKPHNLSGCSSARELAGSCVDDRYKNASDGHYRMFIKYERPVTKINLTE